MTLPFSITYTSADDDAIPCNVGVMLFVILSVFETPVSVDVASVGTDNVAGTIAAVLLVSVVPEKPEAWLPKVSLIGFTPGV